MNKPDDSKTLSKNEFWEVSHAAGLLTSYACSVSARHIQDGMLRLQFNREVAYYMREIVRDVESGRKSAEQGIQAIKEEQKSLASQSATIFQQSVGLAAGGLQVGTGVALCIGSYGLACGVGSLSMIHGANNIYENGRNLWEGRSDTEGPVRHAYQYVAKGTDDEKFYGNIAYGSVDLVLSGYGLLKPVLKKDSWRLFRYIESDYTMAKSRVSFLFDRTADSVTANGMFNERKNNNE